MVRCKRVTLVAIGWLLIAAVSGQAKPLAYLWIGDNADRPDTYVAFRGQVTLNQSCDVTIRFLGAAWFNLWLDGEFLTEGPARFPPDHPEYDETTVHLAEGVHTLAAQVHHIGVTTRMLQDFPSFWACEAFSNGEALPVQWRCVRLPGYSPEVRRINPQLGWIEWCDTRQLPVNWQANDFDDSAWSEPVRRDPGIGEPQPLSIDSVRSFTHEVEPIDGGPLAEVFGYERDDIPMRFFLRDLKCDRLPPQGIWRRYDLGRVRLMRPRFVLDLPAGALVEFAYSETLSHGRVSPVIPLSAGPSCNLDHSIARGGVQEFFPLTPKGGRYVELHILGDASQIRFIKQQCVERGYHDDPIGSFTCGDALLERIWQTGIDTYRGCMEDALIDTPTRERGQWTGDVVTVGMDIAAAGYSDLRVCRRALVQSAYSAREDGLIAGLCPGGNAYLSSYSAQWTDACLHYYELTGDRDLLVEMLPYAERNLLSFEPYLTDDGLKDGLGWTFIDWGYKRPEGPVDRAYNLHFLNALRSTIRWCQIVDREDRIPHYEALEKRVAEPLSRWFETQLETGETGWKTIGYHCAVLGLKEGFFHEERERQCVDYIKAHILDCFPNEPYAPRNSDPALQETRLITPYFAQYAFPLLIERGGMDFVLGQFRTCWGWALEDDRTTWIEVFDTRWSHCHQWAGCPTWQLSRYGLGLHPRYDWGIRHFRFSLYPGDLPRAEGQVPLPGESQTIVIQWEKHDDGFHYELKTPVPIVLHIENENTPNGEEIIDVESEFSRVLQNPQK